MAMDWEAYQIDEDIDDAPDITLENWQTQITDAEPDPLRQHGSVHRGAAYLSPNYPPHGASAGQEGGEMIPEEMIEVNGDVDDAASLVREVLEDLMPPSEPEEPETTVLEEVLGLAHYVRGLDALGAGLGSVPLSPPRAGFKMVTTPGGRQITSLVITKDKLGNPAASVKNAQDVGKRAIAIGKKLQAAASKAPARVVAKPTPKKTTVHGAVAPKKLGKRLSPAAMKKLAAQAIKGGQDLLSKAAKLHKINQADAQKKASGLKSVQAKMAKSVAMSAAKPATKAVTATARTTAAKATTTAARVAPTAALRMSTVVHGEMLGYESRVLGDYVNNLTQELLGELVADRLIESGDISIYGESDENTLVEVTDDVDVFGHGRRYADEINVFGYYENGVWVEDTTTTDPGYVDPGYVDPGYVDDSTLDTSSANNYGLGPAPTAADVVPTEAAGDFVKGPDAAIDSIDYTKYPVVEGTQVPVKGGILYDGMPGLQTNCFGSWTMFYGPSHNSGLIYGGSPPHWIEYLDVANNKKVDPIDFSSALQGGSHRKMYDSEYSINQKYGPVVGNPSVNGFGGLRRGPNDTWFWFWNEAPDRLKQPILDKRLTEALVDFGTKLVAAKADAAAKALQDQVDAQTAADLAKQQALEDAANQRAMDQEQTQAEHQANLQSTASQADVEAMSRQEEAATAAEEHRQQLQEEREARTAQTQDERDMAFAERAQTAEEGVEEREDERTFNLARMADEAAMQDGGEEQQEAPSAEGHELEEGPMPPMDPFADETEEDMLGARAVTRLRERVKARR